MTDARRLTLLRALAAHFTRIHWDGTISDHPPSLAGNVPNPGEDSTPQTGTGGGSAPVYGIVSALQWQ